MNFQRYTTPNRRGMAGKSGALAHDAWQSKSSFRSFVNFVFVFWLEHSEKEPESERARSPRQTTEKNGNLPPRNEISFVLFFNHQPFASPHLRQCTEKGKPSYIFTSFLGLLFIRDIHPPLFDVITQFFSYLQVLRRSPFVCCPGIR